MDETPEVSVVPCTVRSMSDDKKPPVAQTLTLLFDNDPTWGDLIWFAEQVKASGVDLGQEIIFEWDHSDHQDPNPPMVGMSFFTHPDPAQLLER